MTTENTEKVYLTPEGFMELEAELNFLRNEKRPGVIEAIKEARALGDLSENADYDAAKNEQAELEARIQKLEKNLGRAVIIEKKLTDKVAIGSSVEIKYLDDNEIEEYTIVGSQEVDPASSKISNESPIALAIMGHKKGDTCKVQSPTGEYQIKIIKIS